MTTEQKIWNYLKEQGLSDAGAAGLMGNLYAESGLSPTNLQNSYEKKLGYTDASYTSAVDNGSYTNFVRDSAGYGLAQWTYWSRKEALLAYVKAAGKSVGDLDTQLGFLIKELTSYGLLSALKTATSVKAASDLVLVQFEKPADQSDAAKTRRAGYGQTYFDKYAGKGGQTVSFVPRLTRPEAGNKYYIRKASGGYNGAIKGSPTDPGCDVLANCVGYAVGRFNEIVGEGSCKYLSSVNAEQFIQYKGDLEVGMEPRLGACAVWQKGATLSSSDGAGHVAIVEKIVSPTEIVTSDSGWGAANPFWTQTRKKGSDGNWGQGSGYKFLGFIYNPAACCQGTSPSTQTGTSTGGTSGAAQAPAATVTEKRATEPAMSMDAVLAGSYAVTASSGLHIRNGAGTSKASFAVLPKGTKVRNYGYYTTVSGIKWLYVQVTYNGVKYTGFCSSEYLSRV